MSSHKNLIMQKKGGIKDDSDKIIKNYAKEDEFTN